MVIITTLYNAAPYIEKSIGSIIGQSFSDFKCYITDDISTDNSVKIAEDMTQGDERFIFIKNTTKHYQPGNYDQVIRNNPNIHDNEIIVEIDGDDWLPNSLVLERINEIYKDPNIWIANGSFKYSDGRQGFASPPVDINNIRNEKFAASHLRTWRAFLWRAIKESDLKDDVGKYWEVAGDLAFMFPMIEMAGLEHYYFMSEINYVYNEENPINDHKVNMNMVNKAVGLLRNKTKYKKLIR